MIRVFFPGQDVPAWLEKVEITKGDESNPEAKLPEVFKFGSLCVVVKYRGYFYIWAPLWFGNCAMRVENGGHFTITGGGKGVYLYHTLKDLLAALRYVKKGGAKC